MKCLNCGNELPDGALFCDNCGQKTEKELETGGFCGNCGAKAEAGVSFCGECGAPLNDETTVEAPRRETSSNGGKAKSGVGKTVMIMLVVCIAVMSGLAGYFMYRANGLSDMASGRSNAASTPSATAASTPKPTDALEPSVSASPTPSSAPAATVEASASGRTVMYSSSLTYKRMSEIHNTVSVTDENDFDTLKAIIVEFNKQCENYMNEITDNVPAYLRYGTTAYEQQVEYKKKHPNLNQSVQSVDVLDARQGGGYYYVWATEVLNVNENGSKKTTTSHWVYKIENNGGYWSICDYTADPAY